MLKKLLLVYAEQHLAGDHLPELRSSTLANHLEPMIDTIHSYLDSVFGAFLTFTAPQNLSC